MVHLYLTAFLLCFVPFEGVLGQDCAPDGRCDTHERCPVWREQGECLKNKDYMNQYCPGSCAAEKDPVATTACQDLHVRCPAWAAVGECYENPANMRKYCRKSCGMCDDEDDGAYSEEDAPEDPFCRDSHENCAFWASKGECTVNPSYMGTNCAKSCGTCETNTRATKEESEEHRSLLDWTTSFGEKQQAMGTEASATVEVIRQTVEYMSSPRVTNLPREVREKCLNRNELCAFWAVIGECEKNPAFMVTNCAPSCKSCEKIDLKTRCPDLVDAVPALQPGDLNRMFDRIVKTAPGNRTLSEKERQELEDDLMTEYTVMVVSGPEELPTGEPSIETDKDSPPWIITFDNLLTAEECKALIDAGYDEGYERSRDVGAQKFDGSFDGQESKGRTSENAWCSDRSGCRSKPMVQRIMNRMGKILGIPPENSEDLQILKYEKNQFYNSHHDYIPHQRDRQCGPRILTFFLYLSDVTAGGGTDFPYLGHTVMPKAGRAVLWPSVLNSSPMNVDTRTQHAALPVEAGTKFAANAWIHTFDYLGPQSRGCN